VRTAPVGHEYVPDEELLQGNARFVTARHLLNHTAGFPNWHNQPGAFGPADPAGRHSAYSDEGYFLLQRVIESITDRPFERLARVRIFVPLDMNSTSFVRRPGTTTSIGRSS